jgi:hypothetical protein
MSDQYTPIPTSKEVRELRRELQSAREEIDRLHDHVRNLESDLCLAQPRQLRMSHPHPRTVQAFISLRREELRDLPIEDFARTIGTTTNTVNRVFASLAESALEQE